MADGPGHIQPKLHGQIMSKQALIGATWAVCAPPGRMSGCPGHRGQGLTSWPAKSGPRSWSEGTGERSRFPLWPLRPSGYENFATFQPMFLYQGLLAVTTGAAIVWGAKRFSLPGERVFALQAAAYAAAGFGLFWLGIGHLPVVLGLRAGELGPYRRSRLPCAHQAHAHQASLGCA